jgi:preprotein translocase subunit SecA
VTESEEVPAPVNVVDDVDYIDIDEARTVVVEKLRVQ